MCDGETQRAREADSAHPIAPYEPWKRGGEHTPKQRGEVKVPAVLPLDERVLAEVGSVGLAGVELRFEDHPADVGPEEPAFGVVGVEIGVGVSMMRAMGAGPPEARALDGACAAEEEEELQGFGGAVGPMRPEAVVACACRASMGIRSCPEGVVTYQR